jgi:hypothetical protein
MTKRCWPDGVVEVKTSRGWRIVSRAKPQTVSYPNLDGTPRVRLKAWVKFVVTLSIVVGIVWIVVKLYAKNSNPLGSTALWRDWTPV